MADTRRLQLIIDAENKTNKAMAEVSTGLTKMQDKVKSMGPTFKKMALVGGIAFGAISVGVKKMVTNASDLEESINAVEVVFADGADTVLKFGENAAIAVGMTTSAFNQMSTQTGALLKDTGLSAEEVAEQTIMLTKRASDMASVFNTDVSDAMSAINQALRGETEAIRRYAGDVTDATLETYALSQGIEKNVTDMTQQEKRLLRIDLLMAQTEVTAGDFANTSDSLANRQRILGATIENISATLGATFIPIIQQVLDKVAPLIEKLSAWISENPKLARNIIIVVGAITGLIAVIGIIGLVIPAIITGVLALGAAFMFLSANPIGMIIMAIGWLIAVGVLLVKNWDTIKENAILIWNSVVELFRDTWIKISDGITEAWDAVVYMFKEVWDRIKSAFSSALAWISNKFVQATKPITDAWKSLWEGLTNSVTMAWEGVKNTVKNSINWIIGKINAVINKINAVAQKAAGVIGLTAPQIPNIPLLAEGGIVTRPTLAVVGEAGPEAVIPLKQGMAGIGGGNITINITGNEFLGEEGIADRIGNQLMRVLKDTIKL